MSRLWKWFLRVATFEGEVNTVYFSFFLFFVLTLSVTHFYLWKTPFTGIPLFFFLHALGQCFLEAGLLLLVGLLLNRWMPKWLFYIFIGFSFSVLLAHFADFTIARLMDASISYIFHHFFGSGISHLVPAFQSLNMNTTMILISFGGILLIPFVGILFYSATSRLSKLIRWRPSMARLIVSLLAVGASLFTLDLLFHPFLHRSSYTKYQKALPLGATFLSPEPNSIVLPKELASSRNEWETLRLLEEKTLLSASKPNIYLFVIETFRKDFVNEEIAPALTRFGKENISFERSFSNANSTHPSWFSIFHADVPYHWTSMRESWEQGSIPLRILKNLGYKISAFSSADLHYFNMDELIFGKNRQLADRIDEYSQVRFIEPCARDAMGIDALFKELEKPEGRSGNLFIVFLDSTHSEYSFPDDFPLKFTPIAKEIDYLTLQADNIEPLKNRYRNSIAYIDSLFERFIRRLNEENLYEKAIIAVTGDHGEEFFEEGAIFHGTHLNHYQTSVPLFYKFENNPWVPLDRCSTHLDIFPSIIHYLTGRSDFEDLFDGKSLFAPNRPPYRIAVLNNGPQTPCEFALFKEDERFTFRFSNPESIYDSAELEIIYPLQTADLDLSILAPLLK